MVNAHDTKMAGGIGCSGGDLRVQQHVNDTNRRANSIYPERRGQRRGRYC